MAKYNRNEQEALFDAIEYLADKSFPKILLLCNLYDKISGVKYSKSKNTYEFITKKEGK
jgi:hypothetical protein